jgi:transcriptional regulator GlxA family with amidase domain
MIKPINVGILGFDGVAALDMIGPLEAFSVATVDDRRTRRQGYATSIIGMGARSFVAESGVIFKPHRSFPDRYEIDTLIIPGGIGLRKISINARVASWIASRAPRIRRIASVCTGIYGLAPTHLLDGRHVTTHWRFTHDVARNFPKLKVDANALFRKDGKFYTSAGVTAGIDLALALIEEDYGMRAALAVARELVVYVKRAGGQAQYSEPLQFQTESADSFGDLIAWVRGHLQDDLSVETLAKRACLCVRHFNRRFKREFHRTPAAFVEDLRLSEARRRLGTPGTTIDSVAASVGFRSADVFRRTFARRFDITPSDYRRRFKVPVGN